tara:strand:+ start:27197 stop:28186 length:990 start_codon:yes stop_codon:yes gene_type:complete
MSTVPPLGRLEKVQPRAIWEKEDRDFTPWLAEAENISLLGDTIGLDLQVEAVEKDVGPYRADILCKDANTANWVLVENQLEKTDHVHLGQLMVYAAGLHAATIVWIADRFTEEHRAALDWLNEITSGDINFFGLEVELWRIGESMAAPKFNVVSKPNDWSRSLNRTARQLDTDLTPTKQLQLEYWQSFTGLMTDRGGSVKPTKPHPQHWINFSVGRTGFNLYAIANTRDKRISIGLWISDAEAEAYFQLLLEDRAAIETEIDSSLLWVGDESRKSRGVRLDHDGHDPTDKSSWKQQHEWLYETLQRFHSAFSVRVKGLDTSDLLGPVTE